MIQHTGSTFGYNSMITILPHSSSAIYTAISGNDNGYSFRASLHSAVLDLLLGESPWINSTNIATFPAPWVRSSRKRRNVLLFEDNKKDGGEADNMAEDEADDWVVSQARYGMLSSKRRRNRRAVSDVVLGTPLANFEGSFVHGAYGTANITLDAKSGKLEMAYGIGKWELSHSGSEYVFAGDWLGPYPTYDISVRFLVNNNVYGFECLDCDPSYVPAFYRHK